MKSSKWISFKERILTFLEEYAMVCKQGQEKRVAQTTEDRWKERDASTADHGFEATGSVRFCRALPALFANLLSSTKRTSKSNRYFHLSDTCRLLGIQKATQTWETSTQIHSPRQSRPRHFGALKRLRPTRLLFLCNTIRFRGHWLSLQSRLSTRNSLSKC